MSLCASDDMMREVTREMTAEILQRYLLQLNEKENLLLKAIAPDDE